MNEIKIPIEEKILNTLKAGTHINLKGEILVARDQAHKKIIESLKTHKALKEILKNQLIFYMGPSPAPPSKKIGSAGPTTSSRMDKFVLPLLENGIKGFIGKGKRDPSLIKYFQQYKAIYLITYGGLAALLSNKITDYTIIDYPELGTEALAKIYVKNFPAIVAIDIFGNSIY